MYTDAFLAGSVKHTYRWKRTTVDASAVQSMLKPFRVYVGKGGVSVGFLELHQIDCLLPRCYESKYLLLIGGKAGNQSQEVWLI